MLWIGGPPLVRGCSVSVCCRSRVPAAELDSIPKDTCILELSLPDGAMVTVDGRDLIREGCLERLLHKANEPMPNSLFAI